ncbi:hypothetical protein BDW74DRAFT_176624 [Aspergillus multicolor]|uniref:uncharacterized protein n=1 Tax=Aspergillus multicolor TaxID=41759 RepID=UPI003CCDF03A
MCQYVTAHTACGEARTQDRVVAEILDHLNQRRSYETTPDANFDMDLDPGFSYTNEGNGPVLNERGYEEDRAPLGADDEEMIGYWFSRNLDGENSDGESDYSEDSFESCDEDDEDCLGFDDEEDDVIGVLESLLSADDTRAMGLARDRRFEVESETWWLQHGLRRQLEVEVESDLDVALEEEYEAEWPIIPEGLRLVPAGSAGTGASGAQNMAHRWAGVEIPVGLGHGSDDDTDTDTDDEDGDVLDFNVLPTIEDSDDEDNVAEIILENLTEEDSAWETVTDSISDSDTDSNTTSSSEWEDSSEWTPSSDWEAPSEWQFWQYSTDFKPPLGPINEEDCIITSSPSNNLATNAWPTDTPSFQTICAHCAPLHKRHLSRLTLHQSEGKWTRETLCPQDLICRTDRYPVLMGTTLHNVGPINPQYAKHAAAKIARRLQMQFGDVEVFDLILPFRYDGESGIHVNLTLLTDLPEVVDLANDEDVLDAILGGFMEVPRESWQLENIGAFAASSAESSVISSRKNSRTNSPRGSKARKFDEAYVNRFEKHEGEQEIRRLQHEILAPCRVAFFKEKVKLEGVVRDAY